MWRKFFSRVTVRKGEYGGKYKVINCGLAWNRDCTICETMILLWGPLKITFSGGWLGPPANIVLGHSELLGSQPLLHVMARLKPASSKNMNGFHQLPALLPWKMPMFASGLPVSSSRGSPVSASNHWILDSTTALRPIDSPLAPSTLVSTMARHPTSSTLCIRCLANVPWMWRLRLRLVSHRPSAASGFHSSGFHSFTSSLHPSGSVRLLLPSSFTFILSLLLHLGPPDPLCRPGSVSVRLRLGLHRRHHHKSSIPGSTFQASTMATPSSDSAMGPYPGWALVVTTWLCVYPVCYYH